MSDDEIYDRLISFRANQREDVNYLEVEEIRSRMKAEVTATIRRASDSLNAISTDGKPGLAQAVSNQLEWLALLLATIGAAS